MSGLKDYDIMDIEAMDDERLEKSESGKIQVTRVYIKDEADKVIAELKEKRDTAEKLLNKALDCVSNGKKHIMSLARKNNHANYKRCLAMAKRCFTKSNYHFVLARHGEDVKENNRRSILYSKWHKHWLAIAEKFKEGV